MTFALSCSCYQLDISLPPPILQVSEGGHCVAAQYQKQMAVRVSSVPVKIYHGSKYIGNKYSTLFAAVTDGSGERDRITCSVAEGAHSMQV